jgi:hypothetical protein
MLEGSSPSEESLGKDPNHAHQGVNIRMSNDNQGRRPVKELAHSGARVVLTNKRRAPGSPAFGELGQSDRSRRGG